MRKQKDRREVVAQQGVGDGQRLAHGRLEETSLRGVPEDLVEQPKVEAKRVVRLVPEQGEGDVGGGVDCPEAERDQTLVS